MLGRVFRFGCDLGRGREGYGFFVVDHGANRLENVMCDTANLGRGEGYGFFVVDHGANKLENGMCDTATG